MRIELNRLDGDFHFEARNEAGNTIHLDSGGVPGKKPKGVGPMQVLLMGLGGCSAIDIVSILKKQKQSIETFRIEIDGERQKGAVPSLWETVHIRFVLTGDVEEQKATRAAELSMTKYCSVTKTLEKTAAITWSCSVNGREVKTEGQGGS